MRPRDKSTVNLAWFIDAGRRPLGCLRIRGDVAIPAQSSIDYFESVQSVLGNTARERDLAATQDFYRLSVVPGMSYCAGGIGATSFGNGRSARRDPGHDLVNALEQWVERGIALVQIIATGFVGGDPAKGIETTPPLCPYPRGGHVQRKGRYP